MPQDEQEKLAAMTEEEFAAYRDERLARFGGRAGKHGALSAITVPVMVRLSRDANLRAETLARQLGTRKSTLLAQLGEVASYCHAQDWYRAVAAFQAAQKRRATSELTEAGLRPEI